MVQDVVNLADKADTVMSTSGDMVYYTDSRQRLAISDNDKILQIKSQIPSWETLSSSGASTALDNLSSVAVNTTIDMDTNDLINVEFFRLKSPSELTIDTNGNVTFTQSYHTIDTFEDASTDSLDGFLGLTTGSLLFLSSADSSRDPTLRSGITGENKMSGAGNFTLLTTTDVWCGIANTGIKAYFNIVEVSRSTNTA